MSGVGGLLELYWNFIGVDRNFIGTVSLRYCYVIATLLLRYCYVIATLLLRYCYVIATLLVRYRYVIGGRSGLDRGCPIYGASPSDLSDLRYVLTVDGRATTSMLIL